MSEDRSHKAHQHGAEWPWWKLILIVGWPVFVMLSYLRLAVLPTLLEVLR